MAGNAIAGSARDHSFQTARLTVGRHDRPGAEVCIMELASMLAGERFSDRPRSVCSIIGALLRAYNDNVDDRRREDLYRYAAEAVGTRGDLKLQLRRAEVTIAWARAAYEARIGVGRGIGRVPRPPEPDAGPDEIARYMLGSLGVRRRAKRGEPSGGWSDATHASVLALIDLLIEMGTGPVDELALELRSLSVGELPEQLGEPVEDRCGDAELVV